MRRSLTWKLTLAFLLVAATVAGLVAAFLRFSSVSQLDRLIAEQQRGEFHSLLADYYQTNGSWAGVTDYLARVRHGPPPSGDGQAGAYGAPNSGGAPGPGGAYGPDARRDRREFFGLVDDRGQVIIPLLPDYPQGAQVSEAALKQGEPIDVNGQVVGVILTAARPPGLNPEEVAYLERTNSALLTATVGAVLVALAVGVLLARTLTQPLRALTQAVHRMAGGDLEQTVTVKSADELGELGLAFNRMSREVARANTARRQMTADIAHELRTPLTVIAGYVESMRDGDLAPTPERLSVIYSEIERLQHLVGDLRILTQADAGELHLIREPLQPEDLLRQARAAFEHQAAQQGVRLRLELNGGLPAIVGDETRLAQVLVNLISNALRYTPSGGEIVLGAARRAAEVTLSVQDTGQGIAPADLPFVFNRLYRADQARASENGESGLGLAIAKALVEAHGGRIEAQSTLGVGTTVFIHLPIDGGAAGPTPAQDTVSFSSQESRL